MVRYMLRTVFRELNWLKTKTGYGVALGWGCFLMALIPGASWLMPVAALLFWLVCLLSWPNINPRNKRQMLLLMSVGLLALMIVWWHDGEWHFWALLEGNLAIVAMLAGVSVLGLLPDSVKQKPPMMGAKGVLSTWYSVQLLGAVINMSAVFVVGDKLQRQTTNMTLPQYAVLIRALTSAGWWSPFFASVAVALSIAPAAQFHQLLMVGIPIAILASLLSLWEFHKKQVLDRFSGFPLALTALRFPVVLAALVLLFHYFVFPDIAILAVVTMLSPLSVLVLLFFKRGPRYTKQRALDHMTLRFPNMANEFSLFLAAGFLTTTVGFALKSVLGNEWALFNQFGFVEAYTCYLAICAIALLGLHPIVGISLMSTLVPYGDVNNTLLAFVSLCAWAVGTSISPLSGINLSVSSKYGTDNYLLARYNLLYGAIMSVLVALAMLLLVVFIDAP